MMTGRERRRLVPHIRPRVAARMRNLQSQVQIAVGVRAETLAVRGNQLVAESGDRRLRRRCQHQLIRIRAPVVANGDRFASPHQFRAADSEIAPSPAGQIAGLAVRSAVPPLHRKDAEAIANAGAVDLDRLREGAGRVDLLVELKRDVRAFEVSAKGRRRFQRGNPGVR